MFALVITVVVAVSAPDFYVGPDPDFLVLEVVSPAEDVLTFDQPVQEPHVTPTPALKPTRRRFIRRRR